jgi:hypothetical protein
LPSISISPAAHAALSAPVTGTRIVSSVAEGMIFPPRISLPSQSSAFPCTRSTPPHEAALLASPRCHEHARLLCRRRGNRRRSTNVLLDHALALPMSRNRSLIYRTGASLASTLTSTSLKWGCRRCPAYKDVGPGARRMKTTPPRGKPESMWAERTPCQKSLAISKVLSFQTDKRTCSLLRRQSRQRLP